MNPFFLEYPIIGWAMWGASAIIALIIGIRLHKRKNK